MLVTIFLVKIYGLYDVAFGALLPNGIETLIFVLPYTLRIMGIKFKTVLREVILPVLIPATLLTASILLLRETIQPVSFISIAFIGGMCILTNLISYLVIGINLPERKIILELAYNAYQAVEHG